MTQGALLTKLETRLIDAMHDRYGLSGFPAPQDVSVCGRDQSGAGRYTFLAHVGEFQSPDGELFGGHVDMPCLPFGATFFLTVEAGKITRLEILVNGTATWSGEEREPITIITD